MTPPPAGPITAGQPSSALHTLVWFFLNMPDSLGKDYTDSDSIGQVPLGFAPLIP